MSTVPFSIVLPGEAMMRALISACRRGSFSRIPCFGVVVSCAELEIAKSNNAGKQIQWARNKRRENSMAEVRR
jgi:hypothetical protein